MSVGDVFSRRVNDDVLCAAVARAVTDGDDTELRRLGLGGFGEYVQRRSDHMGESVRAELTDGDFGELMEQSARPMHYAHHLVNEAGTAVLTAKDKPLGIHIKPQETDFDDDALRSTVGNAAVNDDPAETVKALADGLSYAVKKLGSDFVQANAEQRSRMGFEVRVKRSGSSKCCPWCSARIGSWSLANAPDGVFGCHDNCSCVVEYMSSTGAVSRRNGTGRFAPVTYQPHRGVVQGAEKTLHRLTGGGNGGIINKRGGDLLIISMQYFANKNIPKMSDRELIKSIDSWKRRIIEHKTYLKDPLPHCPNWELFDERYRNGLKRHWEHEIKTLEADIKSASEELERRKKYD